MALPVPGRDMAKLSCIAFFLLPLVPPFAPDHSRSGHLYCCRAVPTF
jgi:hypothetical protein